MQVTTRLAPSTLETQKIQIKIFNSFLKERIFNFSRCRCLQKRMATLVDLLGTLRSNGVKSLARFVKIKTCSSDMVQM